MNVRNRMADITKLRCNAYQDFLKLISPSDWKNRFYLKVKDSVESKSPTKNKYLNAYEKIRDYGLDSYTIDDMDVTLISALLLDKHSIFSIKNETRSAIKKLVEDRNSISHLDENESDDELYLIGLLSLCNMKNFIQIVDRHETNILDSQRLNYRQKYVPMIEQLKSILDDERMELLRPQKSINADIRKVLHSNNPSDTWWKLEELYRNRYWKLERNPEIFYSFIVKSSDAGIKDAHLSAVDYFLYKKDYAEFERRLLMIWQFSSELSIYEINHIIGSINSYISVKSSATEGMLKIISEIKHHGYNITQNGAYYILNN